jgi:hypothetical protein
LQFHCGKPPPAALPSTRTFMFVRLWSYKAQDPEVRPI